MILLSPPGGIAPSYVLRTFATYEQCASERNRVGFDMAAAYPFERDFVITCRPHTAVAHG